MVGRRRRRHSGLFAAVARLTVAAASAFLEGVWQEPALLERMTAGGSSDPAPSRWDGVVQSRLDSAGRNRARPGAITRPSIPTDPANPPTHPPELVTVDKLDRKMTLLLRMRSSASACRTGNGLIITYRRNGGCD